MPTSSLILSLAVVALGGVIFSLDLLTPPGFSGSLLYLFPLVLTNWLPWYRAPFQFAGLFTGLTLLGFLLAHYGVTDWVSISNRIGGVGLLWALAVTMAGRKRAAIGMITAEAGREQAIRDLAVAQREREQAEMLKTVAAEARAHAETAMSGVLASRREVEAKLLEAKLSLAGLVQSAMDAIVTVDEDQKVVLFNKAAEQMFGVAGQEAVGQPLDRFIPPRFREVHRRHMTTFGQSGATSRRMGSLGHVTGLRANGEEFPLEAAISHVAVEGRKFYSVILRDMTDRERAEEALRQARDFSEALLETASALVVVLDTEGRILRFNRACELTTGYSSEEVLGKSVWDLFILSEDLDDVQSAFVGLRGGLSDNKIENYWRTKDGRRRLISWTNASLKNAQGVVEHIIATGLDITDRRQAEAALREAQERFQDIFEASKDAIGYASLDGNWILANEAFGKLTGYSRQELHDTSYTDLTPHEYRAIQAEALAKVFQTGEPIEYEKEYIRKDGSHVPVALTVFAVKGNDGRPVGLAMIARDISERKRAERLLRQSEERYRRLVEVSPDAVFVNRGDRIVYINDQCMKLFGATSADQLLGKSLLELFHPDYHAVIREPVHHLIEGSEALSALDGQIIRLDGTVVDVELSASRFKDEEGIAIQVELRDVSERKRMQEQLKKTERLAELGTLASGMAHEIGTPMNVILGRAEYLMDRVKDEPIKKGLQTIVDQVERITKVMNQLLAFARRRPIERQGLDLRHTIKDNLEMFQERLAHNQIKIETAFAESCPLVHADTDHMSQVVINLVMNAIHAMPNGGTLRVGLAPSNGMVRLTVADTGHGMPQEVVSKIFDPFFTTKEFGKGTGLGLTVVKGIMEEHGGSITVKSEPGKGTTFTVTLPTHQPNQ